MSATGGPPAGTEAGRRDVARLIADALREGFDRHYRLFREESVLAKGRFERAEWAELQQAVAARVRFYDERVRESVERLRAELAADSVDEATWQLAKLLYIGLLVDHRQPELAETFFNSVTTRILHRTYHNNDFIFVRPAISTEHIASDPPIYRSYYPLPGGLRETLVEAFADIGWARPFAHLAEDVDDLVDALLEHLGGTWPTAQPNRQVRVLGSPFYRNKAAYVIGALVNGDDELPFVVPVLHDPEGGLVLDTVLLDQPSLDTLFSLSRAYFLVDMNVPSGYVDFLRATMPTKPRSELYTAIGLGKQGKTLFVRDLQHHLHHSADAFVEAPGTRGQVMHVFTLPSYPYVIKVIRDVFGPAKSTDRDTVMRKFAMVKEVDRVGRMADTLEFRDLALPRHRFAPGLLAELLELTASSIELEDDSVVVRHCYVERRLVPLNLFLETATPAELVHAVREYGNAIRELAIANVFPGDMLWRNFGVTRHGRVVFYDYDEIEYLTDCTFRAIPPAPTPEAELADEPWYPVAPHDVFPEEWSSFLLGDPRVRDVFLLYHAELLQPAFWQACQERVEAGEIVDFYPYPETRRFAHRRRAAELRST